MEELHDYRDLVKLAKAFGFTVTSTTSGSHNLGSAHYRGKAIDVRTRDKSQGECESFIGICRRKGLTVRDERRRPQHQKVWTGPHLHIEIPRFPLIG